MSPPVQSSDQKDATPDFMLNQITKNWKFNAIEELKRRKSRDSQQLTNEKKTDQFKSQEVGSGNVEVTLTDIAKTEHVKNFTHQSSIARIKGPLDEEQTQMDEPAKKIDYPIT